MLYSYTAVCSPAYGYDPGTLVLLWFPHLFAHITSAKFALYPLLFSHILPACDISAQIQCGTGISILNVLNCLCHSWQFLLLLCNAVAKPASILAKGGILLSEDFYSHRQSRWFFTLKRTKKPLSLHRESGLKPRNYLWIDFHKNRYIPLLPRNIYFLWQHGWFPDLWLTVSPKKNTFSECKHPNGILSFSSSITVMAVASDFHRYFPILLCFHRHHIANY